MQTPNHANPARLGSAGCFGVRPAGLSTGLTCSSVPPPAAFFRNICKCVCALGRGWALFVRLSWGRGAGIQLPQRAGVGGGGCGPSPRQPVEPWPGRGLGGQDGQVSVAGGPASGHLPESRCPWARGTGEGAAQAQQALALHSPHTCTHNTHNTHVHTSLLWHQH